MDTSETEKSFITVVSVGTDANSTEQHSAFPSSGSEYVTVLTIGENGASSDSELAEIVEEVLVYRLPGERLGFGLKFEGGTKANEFVKRLFIQSCAADSPASRVQSSWGNLIEGDEVLEIDGLPVNAMTRIDCVRFLKDSSVVIKLLVKHYLIRQDLPQVISAEKKRLPPPPPPVPPRKVARKLCKNRADSNSNTTTNNESKAISRKFQHSPRSSSRLIYSSSSENPDEPLLGPPDAEVYVDLFSQETVSLSESDDTGSSISTVVDRFGSFPTTTASSLAGSLPSTPTSIQRHLDFSQLSNFYDDEIESIFRLPTTTNLSTFHDPQPQDSSCFQDAPLSYGNEDMRAAPATKPRQNKPPVPPRSIHTQKTTSTELGKCDNEDKNDKILHSIHDENMNVSVNVSVNSLPRLVDFVPKSQSLLLNYSDSDSIEILKEFLDNERNSTQESDKVSFEPDLQYSKWNLSSQLATIGEVEEDQPGQEPAAVRSPGNSTTPIVVIDNADFDTNTSATINNTNSKAVGAKDSLDFNGTMESLSSISRQPPDGHEFPDCIESNIKPTIRKKLHESNSQWLKDSKKCLDSRQHTSSCNDCFSNALIQKSKHMSKANNLSSSDLSSIESSSDERLPSYPNTLHSRSQSLIDMSSMNKQNTNDRWSFLVEQRRKGLSKLKGLMIPENVPEVKEIPSVAIPEIKSHATKAATPLLAELKHSSDRKSLLLSFDAEPVTVPLTSPPWSSNSSTNVPKYSPAFKRKSLEVHSSSNRTPIVYRNRPAKQPSKIDIDNLSDAPKSLESITSPTKSDCSFDYVTNSPRIKYTNSKHIKESTNYISRLYKDLGKSEYESDNDSAVSSSQSSYISRCSPPLSPTRSCEMLDYDSSKSSESTTQCRLLNPVSVEAINRRNILASSKCRSGLGDFKEATLIEPERKISRDEADPKIETVAVKIEVPVAVIQPKKIVTSDNLDVVVKRRNSKSEEKPKIPPYLHPGATPSQIVSQMKTENNAKPLAPVVKTVPTKNSIDLKPRVFQTNNNLADAKRLTNSTTKVCSIYGRNAKSLSVTDLRKSFEKFGATAPVPDFRIRKSEAPKKEVQKPKQLERTNVPLNAASQKIGEVGKKLEEKKGIVAKTVETKAAEVSPESSTVPINSSDSASVVTNARKVILYPEFLGGSIGITLAGGNDYEAKEITVHKIRYGSVAYNDGKIKKGDRIVSINGKATAGLTHAQAVEMLKEPSSSFVLIVEEGKEEITVASPQRKSFIYESTTTTTTDSSLPSVELVRNVTHVISVKKEGASLGFSIEGGKGSPLGDLPLRIKKIFKGGASDKSGELHTGDELLTINDISLTNLSRIEAWSLMKKLPDGSVTIHIHR